MCTKGLNGVADSAMTTVERPGVLRRLTRHWGPWFLTLALAHVCSSLLAGASLAQSGESPLLQVNTGSHTAPIRALDIDRTGRYAVTAADDRTARVWDLANGQLLRVLRPPIGAGNDGKLFAAAMAPTGSIIAVGGWSADNDVYLFDAKSGAMVQRITGLPDVITQLNFSPDGKSLLVGLWGKNGLRLFGSDSDWRNSRELGGDSRYDGSITSAKFSPDGARLASTSADGLVRVYSWAQGTLRLNRSAPTQSGSQAFGLAWSPDGAALAVGFADSPAIAVLRSDTLAQAFSPDITGIANGSLNALAWSPNGAELLAAGTWKLPDGRHGLRRWAAQGQGKATDVSLTGNSIVGIQVLHDGRIVYASADPAWGWLTPTSGTQASASDLAVSSGLIDFRGGRTGFRTSRDGSAIAFSGRSSRGTASESGFDLVRTEWVAPQTQWTAPGVSSKTLEVREWIDSVQPRLNGRPFVLAENEVSMSAALASGSAGVVLGTSLYVRYIKADGTERWRSTAPGTTWQVNVSGNGQWVIAGFSDGTIRWYRASDGTEQLALYPHPDRRRWVIWTPSGYYAAAAGSEDLIGWHLNRGKDQSADFFPASRFRAQFYRPDVVARVIEAGTVAEALRLSDLAAGRMVQAQSVAQALPPVVDILAPQDGFVTSKNELTLRVSVRTPMDAPVQSVRVRVNGLLQADVGVALAQKAGPSASGVDYRDIAVRLPNENADVQVFAENRNGVSLPTSLLVKWGGSKPAVSTPPSASSGDKMFNPKLYVLAVGMSKYRNPTYNLDFAAKDASDFSQVLLQQKGTLYRDVEVRLLTDAKATKDGVLEGLEWLKREVTARDVGILFLAGHGMNDNAGNYYFLPHDINPEQLLRTGVAHNDIKLTLNNIAGKALFFIDTCHSGNALGTAKTRGVADVNAIVNDLASAENGVVVFAASTGRQLSQESPNWGNGAFTKALVEGLAGKADFRKTGIVTHKGLDFYVAERVKELTKGQQSPVSITPLGVADFPIALVGVNGVTAR